MIPNFLTIRNLTEQLRRGVGLLSDAADAPAESLTRDTAVDLSILPVRASNRKRAPGARDVSRITVMVGHVTDVLHGFGVQKWGPDGWKHWLGELRARRVPERLLDQLRNELGPMSEDELATTLALCSRLAQTPYHRLASRKLGECVNRPLEHRTHAAGRGNGGVSMAVDAHHREGIDEGLAAAGRNTFRGLYFALRTAGAVGPIAYCPHGVYSRSRWNDTHRIAHLSVYKPAVLSLQSEGEDVSVDYEAAVGGGRPITTRDDPDAHFDARGRRVRTAAGRLL